MEPTPSPCLSNIMCNLYVSTNRYIGLCFEVAANASISGTIHLCHLIAEFPYSLFNGTFHCFPIYSCFTVTIRAFSTGVTDIA